MAKKSEQVMVRLTPEQKREWENMADEMGFSVPETIRHAMTELGKDDSASIENVDAVEDVADTVEDVDTRTEEMKSQLSTLSSAIGELHEMVGEEVSSVEEQKVLEHLPEKRDCMVKHKSGTGVSENFDPTMTASPHSVATSIDRENPPTDAVRRTLEQMALRSPRVQQVTYNDGNAVGYYIDV